MIKQARKLVITTLALLLGLSASMARAEGASFDCAKAATSVEKLICSDTELSQLDKSLNESYRAKIQAQPDSDLKQTQRVWLKERNQCDDIACLKMKYKARLEDLTLSKIANTQTLPVNSSTSIAAIAPTPVHAYKNGEASASPTVKEQDWIQEEDVQKACAQWRKTTNPPPAGSALTLSVTTPAYPDVWSYIPDSSRGDVRVWSVVLLPDGDVGFSVYNEKIDKINYERLFFNKPLTIDDRCRISQGVGDSRPKVTLSDGRVVTSESFQPRLCPDAEAGLEASVVMYSDEYHSEHPLARKHVLHILNKPRHWKMSEICADEHQGRPFDYRVISVFGWRFLPLPDGTILAVETMGKELGSPSFIVRLNNQLQPKSEMLSSNLFVVDDLPTCDPTPEISGVECIHKKLYQQLMAIKTGRAPQ